ncbi:uncharacterized protein L969DRAFT_84119 [Mixia osmundae IAM 14324]|uniref:Pali-domain-containing protein n=1 Tax=Mixia osmundae (strain CBS 9802 / IAM 14324 / JCM 22182 / KY 12970) TaxID=764103 RepID=G7E0B2_MIXOS|nr:uncharacterized protein L969DRAFT_84119 [Mixia osmundae IAM 14324]KEI42263.1 hypothetical protein L969DRAFT_84119 [Mixia osmundae IAM 14324]GAA96272.1 hypothetical protein E5Q_02937 [Mixia osmundae IAM 14324]
MSCIRPATPGTICVLGATILLVLCSISVPVNQKFYFLSADINATISGLSVDGLVRLGVWGHCADVAGENKCTPATLGYNFDANALLGISRSLVNLPSASIKPFTYVLILHPIAAGLAGLTFIFGLLAHIREFAIVRFTTCLASLATTVSLLAFIFDIIAFSIAKSRINASATADASPNATLGNAVWMTLAGFVLLLLSGCLLGVGQCCFRSRPSHEERDRMKPLPDPAYRRDAEKARYPRETGLPVFAAGEVVPLNSLDHTDARNKSHPERIDGVGYGEARYEDAYPNTYAGIGTPRRHDSDLTHSSSLPTHGRSPYEPEAPVQGYESYAARATRADENPFDPPAHQTQGSYYPDEAYLSPTAQRSGYGSPVDPRQPYSHETYPPQSHPQEAAYGGQEDPYEQPASYRHGQASYGHAQGYNYGQSDPYEAQYGQPAYEQPQYGSSTGHAAPHAYSRY